MGIQINGTNDTITTNDGTISIDGGTTITGSLTGTTGVFSGDVGVAGTLTSEDKTNIDSVGLITARTGIKIGPITGVAATHYADGSIRTTGVVTATQFYGGGGNLTGISADVVDDTSPQLGGNLDVNTKNIIFGDSSDGSSDDVLIFGAGSDLKLYHNGTNSLIENSTGNLLIKDTTGSVYIQSSGIYFQDDTTNEDIAKFISDGAVELYHNNVKKIETTADGIDVTGISKADRVDCDGLFHIQYGTSTNTNYMSSFNNNNGNMVLFRGDGIFVGNNMNTSNQSGGPNNKKIHLDTNGEIKLVDSAKLVLGSDGDCKIHFNGTNTVVDQYNGNFEIAVASASEYSAVFKANDGVDLYHNNVKKCITNSKGITVNSTGAGEGLVSIQAANSSASSIEFGDPDDDDVAQIWYDHYGKNMYFRTSETAGMMWYTSGTERMKLTDGGWFKAKGNKSAFLTGGSYHEILSDNPNNVTLALKHDSSAGYGINIQLNHTNATKYAYQLYSTSSSNTRFVVRGDGDVENHNNSYGSTSDVKLKENITDAGSQWDDLKALKVRNFNFKSDPDKVKMLGLVAQEAELVSPGLIKEIDDIDVDCKDLGTKTKVLKYSILYMKAIKALQEAQTRIETLETKVAALES